MKVKFNKRHSYLFFGKNRLLEIKFRKEASNSFFFRRYSDVLKVRLWKFSIVFWNNERHVSELRFLLTYLDKKE